MYMRLIFNNNFIDGIIWTKKIYGLKISAKIKKKKKKNCLNNKFVLSMILNNYLLINIYDVCALYKKLLS